MNISPWALIQARRDRGLTRRQAAEALGVSSATLLDWEKGLRQPRPGRLVDLAGCYGCHMEDKFPQRLRRLRERQGRSRRVISELCGLPPDAVRQIGRASCRERV